MITEKISIRRMSTGTVVNVTWKVDDNTVHWQVRVLGPTAAQIRAAIKQCRTQNEMLLEGIESAGDREEEAA